MATFLDLNVLNYFSIIFPALLVFAIIFAILQKTKLLGDNKTISAIVGIVCAFMVMLSKDIIAIINFGAPWFIMVFIFLTLLLLIYKFMGASDANLGNLITKDKTIQWAIFGVGLIIVISSISHVYTERLLEESKGRTIINEAGETVVVNATIEKEPSEIKKTIFNPKVLGLAFIMLVAVFSISLLTRDAI